MNPKQSVFIAVSMDGFIARTNGDIDWLTEFEGGSSSEDYGFQEFMDSVDALVMGRNTFEKVLTLGEWFYGTKQVFVLSSRDPEIPDKLKDRVKVRVGSPVDIVDRLADEGFEHLYVDGGVTIQRFLNAGLIQEMTITRIPVLIGEGIPLFGPVEKDIRLNHVSTKNYDYGLVQSRYSVLHPPA